MKTVCSFLLLVAIAITLACGYGSKNYNTTSAAGAVPAISQLSPDSTDAGSSAFALTVNGSNFGSKAMVNWNGVGQNTTYVSGNQLVISIPAAMIAAPATVQITVTNPATTGTGPYGMGGALAETSKAVTFTVN
jgi:hypothetical protein